jgi:HD-GYP domain-containing protein (c-di-GMP phosphodiesterase class II)
MQFLKKQFNQELIIVLLLVIITGIIYYSVDNQRILLHFFYVPVLLGAYFFGKNHGTYSAVLSVLIVVSMAYFIPYTFSNEDAINSTLSKWTDISIWSCFLIITSYAVGTLYEKKEAFYRELHTTYKGIITMLSLIIDSVDKYTQNHSYRVSKHSEKIAKAMGLPNTEIENIRIAALLHDLGKIGVSEEILNKIGKLSIEERKETTSHTGKAGALLEPIESRVLRLLPLILNHHERYDGKGYNTLIGDDIPIGAKIIAVADVYDALTTDRPYRKALSPLEGREEIVRGAGTHFDPEVVKYFEQVFPKLDTEEPLLSFS